MLTSFGKFLRKLRIDRNELLKDMSEKLNVTVSYLSAVENGKRDVPEKWIDIIKDKYELSNEDFATMQGAAYENKDLISVKSSNSKDKKIILSFARSFDELSNDEKKDIWNILNRKKQM